jgi:hypothetical protein
MPLKLLKAFSQKSQKGNPDFDNVVKIGRCIKWNHLVTPN